MAEHAIVGVDAGGTSTRCVVAALDGTVLGCGRAGGANQYSSPDPAASLRAALDEALTAAGGVRVVGSVFGMAGASEAGHARATETATRAWNALEMPGEPYVTDDICAAFAAGSVADQGTVLIAGTGAVAAYVRDGAVAWRCDGDGWLLGDEGSAVWIALRGLRAVLAALDGRGRPTALRERLAAALEVPPGERERIIEAVYPRHPAELGLLAPEVTAVAGEGDAVAREIVAGAADALLASLTVAAGERFGADPVVLAGSLLSEGPVADAVRAGIRARHGAVPLRASEGALGAAALALRWAGSSLAARSTLLRAGLPPAT
ncbi:N-acetylglucosamine kinase-like BadF-type ATPase [Lipingzhangella halophila]|uniref:N-acetylglucosamine kinase-like BadF-type ATPase n=1 Tax=Lipingzhangella halophila TaxID=1783352 RepID=A0A7W7W190_9ACTN|nr:BadF/BadG/BcrA/BcrD ATPase family protein [Lipingzhangella halophila]MBB4930073.1 N-acetylglucosamine kinase-like BadF-type ATPase [Lipingzhangella halophila]